MIFIEPKSSWSSFARLSVQIMDFARNLMNCFMTWVWMGVIRTKNANPANADGPKLMMRRMRQTTICTGAVRPSCRKEQQKSMRDTSVEMWLTSLPLVSVARAREDSLRERS